MAIYHVKAAKGGGWLVQAEMTAGREVHKSLPFLAKDKAALRETVVFLAGVVKEQRKNRNQLRLAQVNRGEETI